MKPYSGIELAQKLAKALKRPCLFIQISANGRCEDVVKAAPYLKDLKFIQLLADESGVIVCDSAKQRDELYAQTVGDDGPTKTNKYKGPCRIYALTIDADGTPVNENT